MKIFTPCLLFIYAVPTTVPLPPSESEATCQETESSAQDSENQGQAEDLRQLFPYKVAEFV